MPYNTQDFREGLSIGLTLNGKIIQPNLNSNVWKYATDTVNLSAIVTLSDAVAVIFPTHIVPSPSDTITLSFIGISDDVTISFT